MPPAWASQRAKVNESLQADRLVWDRALDEVVELGAGSKVAAEATEHRGGGH